MLSANVVLFTAFAYVALLFLVAFVSDMRARKGWMGLVNSPVVYTLSISVYCTSWTFYGAVGSAARNGLEYATIYLGPTLVRSEEHTSELQSLMRISYAVFCLKKK